MTSITLTREYIAKLLPKRPKDANKGTFGKVLVIAGSKFYMGAPYLVAASAYRAGAGLVTLASIPNVCDFVVKKLPEVTLLPLPEKDGVISNRILDTFYEKLAEFGEDDVVVIGPGLTSNPSVSYFIKELFKFRNLPKLIIDGDGINILSEIQKWWEIFDEHDIYTILTPHPKEFSRLTNLSVDRVQKNREKLAKHYAKDWGQTIVLKGANTVIASPIGEIYISPFANPLLATAGTGDVLAGILSGLIAQRMELFDAACLSVYIHGLCGEQFKKEFGDAGAIASDLVDKIPKVLMTLNMVP